MASSVSGVNQSAGSDQPAPTSNQTAANTLAQKETFLKLLVAQIKNQNPMNPADGIEFLSQLAQFSQLEQMMQVRSELEAIRAALTQTGAQDGAASEQTKEMV
jgi:flagellar basal-body rod modification protein FlgD